MIALVADYLDRLNIAYKVPLETNMLVSDWFNERGCAAGVTCANRVTIRATGAGEETLIAVQVFERRRDTATGPRPWIESPRSLGRETTTLARDLEAALAK